MMPEGGNPSILDLGNKAVLDHVRAEKAQSFTVGGTFDGQKVVGGVTYHRTWANGWGATAYLRAWWDDLPVSVSSAKPKMLAGGELTRKF